MSESLTEILVEVAQEEPSCRGLYRVGGAVRDALLRQSPRNGEVDVVVEGSALVVGRRLAADRGGELIEHPRFLTATWKPEGSRTSLDLATARTERYPAPASLPVVEPASLKEDLRRRDFTVNAMAQGLWPDASEAFFDPHGGMGDLHAGLLRTLHPNSFEDDPTRVLRAARFAERLGFSLAPETEAAREAVVSVISDSGKNSPERKGPFEILSADRLRRELLTVFREPDPHAVLLRLERWGVPQALGLRADASVLKHLPPGSEDVPSELEATLGLGLWLMKSADLAAARLGLGAKAQGVWRSVKTAGNRGVQLLAGPIDDLRLEDVLGGASDAELRAVQAIHPKTQDSVERFRSILKPLSPLATGRDLIDWGMAEGPELGEALRGLRKAQLRGEVRERGELYQWLNAWRSARLDT